MKTADLSLETIASGTVPEKFQRALEKVLENILDPNTDAKAKRQITVTNHVPAG